MADALFIIWGIAITIFTIFNTAILYIVVKALQAEWGLND